MDRIMYSPSIIEFMRGKRKNFGIIMDEIDGMNSGDKGGIDALIKLMSEDVPLGQIVAIRAVITLGLLGIFSHSLRSMFVLPARVFWLFFARGMCLVLAMVLFFVSLGSLPLASVIAIFFVSPLIITFLSVPLLGEKIGLHRLTAVIAGMLGVLFIIQPVIAVR